MSARRLAYDDHFEPPAPVAPLRVHSPIGDAAILLRAMLDTGADCTAIPSEVARRLRLPAIDRVRIADVTGSRRSVTVHAARLDVAGLSVLARVVALGDESIVGRDILNRWFLGLDGPALRAAIRVPKRN